MATPKGRMTIRRQALGDNQPRKVRLWTIDTKPGSTVEKLERHYFCALQSIDSLDGKKAELAQNAEFTDIGRQRNALDYAFRELVPEFQKGRRALQKAQQEVATRRSKLQMPKADPADLAAALRRQELRSIMRGMDNKARDQFLKQNGRFTGLDPEIRQAITEMPASLSGISETLRDEFLRETMESVNGPALEEINELETAIEVAASAIEAGREEIRREAVAVDPAYADPDRFNARAVEAANLAGAPWLKVHHENGVEVLRWFDWDEKTKSGGWRIPTSEQIENGIVAKTKDEYEQLKAAAPFSSFGTGPEARTKRAEFVEQHGLEAYQNRNAAA